MRFSDLSFSPTPDISWNKVSGEIPSMRASFLNYHKTLRIKEVSEADAGEYRCTASNRHGTVHHNIRVTVKGEKLLTIYLTHSRFLVRTLERRATLKSNATHRDY